MEIARSTLQFAQTSLCARCTPLSHIHTHLAGAVEAGEFLLRLHTETLPFSLSLPLSLRGDLYLCISKQTQSAPTNSISCGRPLPNFPLLYSSLSLSATITRSFLSPARILSSLQYRFPPLISPFLSSPRIQSLSSFCAAVIQKSGVVPNNCYSTLESLTVALSHAKVIQNISCSTLDSFTALPPCRKCSRLIC